jgi:uncharacterized protein (DUF1697 family)
VSRPDAVCSLIAGEFRRAGGTDRGGCGRVGAVSDFRYFAFLRAINTGSRRLTNEQLLEPFQRLGFVDVAAYQAAGNVTFRSDDPGTVDEARIEAALADAYGFDSPTFVRSAEEMAAITGDPPFPAAEVTASAGKVQVTFLRDEPSAQQIADLDSLVPPEDRVRVRGREWFWLPVDGISTSNLPVGRFEALLGEMTMRTLGTVTRMSAKFSS